MTRPPASALSPLVLTGLVVAGLTLALRLWSIWCSFPALAWNDIRLVPTMMLGAGVNPYPGLEGGPVTTWIYGPVPLLLNLPAWLAPGAASALLVAGTVNLLLALVAARAGQHLSPTAPASRPAALWGFLLAVALWPDSSLQYIQAENAAILFLLLSNGLLWQAWTSPRPRRLELAAAACAVLAAASKQTYAAAILSQLLWLGLVGGARPAARYLAAWAGCGLIAGLAAIASFGWTGLWLNLVTLPGRLPYWPDPADRAAGLAWHLVGYVALPALLLVARRSSVWTRESPWLLPALCWVGLLPWALLGTFKIGGTANSLHTFLVFIPLLAQVVANRLAASPARLAVPILAALCLRAQATVLARLNERPLTPATGHLRQASALCQQLPGMVYFPWSPLTTWEEERRFHHAEDGLYVRYVAGLPPSPATVRRHLPRDWQVSAFRGQDEGWGIILALHPPEATRAEFGYWTLYSWPAPAPAPRD